MTTLLLLAALGLQSSNVTFTSRAESVDQLLKDLGKAAGVQLEASRSVAGDIMLVSVTDKPLQEVMARIARADGAEWRQTETGWRLDPSVRARRDELRDETDRRVRAFEAVIDKRLGEIQKSLATSTDGKSDHTIAVGIGTDGGKFDMTNNSPEAAAVLKILKGIAPSDLGVKSGQRVVYSTNPNSMQVPLGSGVGVQIQQLIDAHNKTANKNNDPSKNSEIDQMPDFIKKMVEKMSKPIDGYAKADLVLSRMPYVSMLEATLVLYDNQGNVVLTAPQVIDAGAIAGLITPAPAQTTGSPVELSDATKAFNTMFAGMRGGNLSKGVVLNDLTRPYVMDPEHHDPLALLPSDELLAVAKKLDEPIVAVIPDESVSILGAMLGAAPSEESVEADLKAEKQMRQLNDPGWLTIQPTYPDDARENRTDRAALAKLMRAVRDKRIPTLDDMAEFSLHAPSPSSPGVSQLYASSFSAGALGQGMDGLANWELFRIYATLPIGVRSSMNAGNDQSLPINTLTQGQIAELKQMVYGPLPQLQVDRGDGKSTDMITQMITSATGGQDYTDEPTEVLPNGLPLSGTLKISVSSEPLLSPSTNASGPDDVPQVMGVDEVAMLKYFSTNPAFAQMAGQMPKISNYKLGSRKVYSFKFEFAPKISSNGHLKDCSLPSDAEVVSADNLPSDVQAAIQKKMEEFKSSPLGAIGALMGSQKSHP
jgi:hypothetical protein